MPHFFSNSPGQSYHFWRICREYKCFTFARYSPQCESSIIFATPHERPRMLTNTYEYLAIILRSLRWVANCIRNPIRHIFATIWQFAANIFFYIRKDIRHSVRLALVNGHMPIRHLQLIISVTSRLFT